MTNQIMSILAHLTLDPATRAADAVFAWAGSNIWLHGLAPVGFLVAYVVATWPVWTACIALSMFSGRRA